MNPMIGGALISAGGSFLSGLLGGKSADKAHKKALKREEKYKARSLVVLRDAAVRAGFNPLTALRATGGHLQGSGVSPVLGSSSALGDAIQAGTSYLANAVVNHDPMRQERDKLEVDLMREQIASMQSERARLSAGFGAAPVVNTGGGARSVSVATGGRGPNVQSVVTAPMLPGGDFTAPVIFNPSANTGTPYTIAGYAIPASPDFSDAGVIEEAAGEAGGTVMGGFRVLNHDLPYLGAAVINDISRYPGGLMLPRIILGRKAMARIAESLPKPWTNDTYRAPEWARPTAGWMDRAYGPSHAN